MIALYVGAMFVILSRVPLAFSTVLDQTAALLDWSVTAVQIMNGVLLLIAVVTIFFVRRGVPLLAGGLLTTILLLESMVYLVFGGWDVLPGWGILWLAIATAVFVFDTRASAALIGFCLILIAVTMLRDMGDLTAREQNWRWAMFLTLTLGTVALSALVYHAVYSTYHHAQINPQDDTQILIKIGANVSQSLLERQDLETFLEQFTEEIVAHFPMVYHAEVYLIKPDSEVATLTASTGTVGQQLLAQEHELDIGGLSAVGRATLTRNPLVIQDYERGTPLKPNPLRPDTRAEYALPLIVGDRVIGALDMQSKQPDAFSVVDLALLQAVGDLLTIALDSLQLHEASERNIRENRALYQQTQANLREIERLNYQLTGSAWSDYLHWQNEAAAVTLDFVTGQATGEAEWTPTLNEAATHQQVITITNEGRRILAVPIVVRNETVGAMEFEIESTDPLPEEVFELAQSVGQRLGLALENRRLFDETQRAAQREALINDIGAELQTATGVDVIIQQTARQLQSALGPQQITIRLGKPATNDQPQPTTSRGQA